MKKSSEFSPGALCALLVGGMCMGSFPPLGKIAVAGGIPPLSYMSHAAAGAAVGLLIWIAVFEKLPKIGFTYFRYCTLTAVTAYVVPSVLTILSVSRLGAGLVSMTYALVPVLTYFLALVYRLEGFQLVRVSGVVCGFLGAVLMTLPDHANTDPANTVWVFIVLMIPVSLALSSIFRSVAWPRGYRPSELAAGMLFASAVILGLMSFWQGERYLILQWAQPEDWVVLAQMVAAFLSYVLLFWIQKNHGPVIQSLMGYISTATGVFVGYLIFGESFSNVLWIALALLIVGMALVNRKPGQTDPT